MDAAVDSSWKESSGFAWKCLSEKGWGVRDDGEVVLGRKRAAYRDPHRKRDWGGSGRLFRLLKPSSI